MRSHRPREQIGTTPSDALSEVRQSAFVHTFIDRVPDALKTVEAALAAFASPGHDAEQSLQREFDDAAATGPADFT